MSGQLRKFGVQMGAVALCLLFAAAARPARAELSLLLEQPYGGLGEVTPMGHTAIYLDHVCAATPLRLRPCRPGELGVVISRYDGIEHYDWLAIPLLSYLYAVDSPAEIPQVVDRPMVISLRDQYRRQHLEQVAPDLPDGRTPPGNWYELVGSAYDRTTYGFTIKTTPDQDAALIAIFNDQRNVERYNGAFRNCADFVRVTINRLHPHAIRRNFIADFGFTTPKSVARSLAHYAAKHPQLGLHAFVIPQVKGSLPRSHAAEGVTEGLLKRYGVPLVVLSPMATAAVFVAYLGHGRFDIPRNAPVLDLRGDGVNLATYDSEPEDATSAAATPRRFPVPSAEMANPLPPAIAAPPASQPLSTPGLLQFPSNDFLNAPALE